MLKWGITLPVALCVLALGGWERAYARHVYPYQFHGAMPDMVRMIDDPRQVGTEDELVVPPRYGDRQGTVKTHDFYPQQETADLQTRRVQDLLPRSPLQAPVRSSPVFPSQPSAIPEFNPDIQLLYPQFRMQGLLQCFGVGSFRNEAMDQWCMENCNHLPSFCPPSHCACNAYKK